MGSSSSNPVPASPASRGGLVARLLTPTVGDILFVLIIGWSFLSGEGGWQRLFQDGDAGLHIRIGDLILAEGQVPTRDPFSFSLPGREWFAFEWGSEVIMAALHQAWGLKGVALMTGVVLSGTFTLLFLYSLWRGANPGISFLLTMLTVNTTSIHFHARPHIFTLLLIAIAVWIVERDYRREDWGLWLLAPLTVIWANLHGGFLILFVYLGLMAAGSWWEGQRTRAIRMATAAAVCSAASLANPYGWKLHHHIIETMQAKWLISIVDEFKSPSFRSEAMTVYMLLLFLALGLLGRLYAMGRRREILILLFLAWASLTSVRHVPIFMLVAAPIVAVELSALWEKFVAPLGRESVCRILDEVSHKLGAGARTPSAWVAVFVLFVAWSGGITWPRDFEKSLFPVELVGRQGPQLAAARVFTTDQWGGYLVYRNHPRQKVFIDGRHNYYGERMVNEFVRIQGGHSTWKDLLDRYAFDAVMIPPGSALATLLSASPDWRATDQDKQAVLYRRVLPATAAASIAGGAAR